MCQFTGRGALITVEGLDRSGKSTQCRMLVHALNGCACPAKGIRFPDRQSALTGAVINTYLSHAATDSACDEHTMQLLFAANRREKQAEMRADIQAGTTPHPGGGQVHTFSDSLWNGSWYRP